MIAAPAFLRRVRIRNYKSITDCDVELGSFTVLVGRNGSGKSNFLDALRFVTEALESSLDFAFKSRGGVDDVFSKTANSPDVVGIDLELSLPDCSTADYGFEIVSAAPGQFRVQRETLHIQLESGGTIGFETKDGNLVRSSLSPPTFGSGPGQFNHLPQPASDRLYLVTIAGLDKFRPVYDALKKMCFYSLNSEQMRQPHKADSLPVLRRDGSNLADVAGRLFNESPPLKKRLLEYLTAIVPDVVDIRLSSLNGFDYIGFEMRGDGLNTRVLSANCMSDGTLRVLGHLLAGMQFIGYGNRLSLVAIEEPETALHPAAASALLDSLREAALQTQIIITSHSPDLIDGIDPDSEILLVAEMRDGHTVIDSVDSSGESTIREHLFSAGELLRLDQLRPRTSSQRISESAIPSDSNP